MNSRVLKHIAEIHPIIEDFTRKRTVPKRTDHIAFIQTGLEKRTIQYAYENGILILYVCRRPN